MVIPKMSGWNFWSVVEREMKEDKHLFQESLCEISRKGHTPDKPARRGRTFVCTALLLLYHAGGGGSSGF